jgi:hypothetical protein
MRSGPSPDNLLDTARAVMRHAIAARVPDEVRYDALMVANAMAIVARQIAAGERPANGARERLAALYGSPDGTLADLEGRLARDVRAGVFDPPGERCAAAFAHLWETARAAAEISNPKALIETGHRDTEAQRRRRNSGNS